MGQINTAPNKFMIRHILVPINSDSDFNFFSRFRDGLAVLGYDLVFLTNKLSLFLRSKRVRVNSHLVSINRVGTCKEDLSKTGDVLLGYLTIREAEDLYLSFYNKAGELAATLTIDRIFFWNGSQGPQNLAVKRFATEHHIGTLFFEAPNIEKKLFVDPQGVNGESFVYNNIDYLAMLNPDNFDYEAWRENFINAKENRPVPPQAKINRGVNNYLFPLDAAAFALFRIPKSGNANIIRKIADKTSGRFTGVRFDVYDASRTDYVFFPMQVRWDTQLLVNSNHTNISGISEAARIAEDYGLRLLVKPHPAENDFSEMSAIMKLKEKYGFMLVNEPSIRLVRHAQRIVTINSSVALEAFLLDKPVRFLGRSIYEKMNHDLLRRFIASYLFDIDKYSKEPVTTAVIQQMLDRSILVASKEDMEVP